MRQETAAALAAIWPCSSKAVTRGKIAK